MSSLKAPVEEVGDGFSKKKEEKTLSDQADDDQGRLFPFTAYFAERDSAVGSTALAGKILHQFFFFKEGEEESPGSGKRLKAFLCRERYLFMNINCFFYEKFISKDLLCCFFNIFFFCGNIVSSEWHRKKENRNMSFS